MVVTDSVADFKIGRVVSRTFSVVTRNLVTFLIASAVIMLPVIVFNLYAGTPNYIVAGRAKGFWFGALAAFIPVVCTYLAQAALVQGTITDLNGERPNLGRALSTGFALLIPVTVIAILSLLGVGLGLVLLVAPGIILGVGWSVAVPVKVVERASIKDSFGRSWELTKGYRWKIFGLVLLYVLAVILFSVLITTISGVSLMRGSGLANNIPYVVLQWVQSVILTLFTAVGVTAIYYELRTVKEGLGPEELAAAFD
jgi:hypothetical protein